MISKNIQNILTKYLSKQASFSDLERLEEWLENSANKEEFINYVKINYLVDMNTRQFNTDESEKKLLSFILKEKKIDKLKRVRAFFKYAAAVVILIFGAYFYNYSTLSNLEEVAIPSDNITLKTNDGNIQIIDEKGSYNIEDDQGNIIGSQKGTELVYQDKEGVEKLNYNTLTVPFGKRFALLLSDGTKVHLNAGTSLKYPVKFLKGKERKVFLEKGEAYFDVAKDAKHPFVVNNDKINVRVLGTQFNMSSYPEDANITTVLVEGSVSLYASELEYDANKATLLESGFKADWNKSTTSFKVDKADVEIYTAWIDGKIILKHMTFNSIIRKLERHYNVEITNNNKALGEDFITATFDIETIEQVFEVINEIHSIDYKINKNKIIINNKNR
ncbi:MAG: ferric-dicitrate binding protein FerR (iron transport regulator) [Paraglaciecola sp.]|jgi:ferric-dicitrate binding protein FerR (iron transport regulator)